MKPITYTFLLTVIFYSCQTNLQEKPVIKDTVSATNDTINTTHKMDFSSIHFASKKDTTCGMPLTAGLKDTLTFKGKIYGFCSKECKDAFIAQLKSQKKL